MNLRIILFSAVIVNSIPFSLQSVTDRCHDPSIVSPGVEYCLNGGVCVNNGTSMFCSCLLGFTGKQCELDINECLEEGTCENGATCVNRPGSFECLCTAGFAGHRCQENIDDCEADSCHPSAICVDGIDSFTCECPPGRYGSQCEKEDLCAVNPCVHGNCSMGATDYYCSCKFGYVGRNCETDLNECLWDPCRNGGRCENFVGSYKCHCTMGFMGENCEELINHCASHPCHNGGSCLNKLDGHQCICMPGFNGTDCEIRLDTSCDLNCQNGGVCGEDFEPSCICPPAFVGERCEIPKPDPCAHDYCSPNGFCLATNNYNSYRCSCYTGFSGAHCEIRECMDESGDCLMSVDYCLVEGNPCQNGAECINQFDGFRCVCPHGYSGPTCNLMLSDESSILHGDVVLILLGSKESFRAASSELLDRIGQAVRASVRFHLDSDGHPMIYSWDSVNGKGDLIDLSIDATDKSRVYSTGRRNRRATGRMEGIIMSLRVDMSPCLRDRKLNSSIICPKSVMDVAAEVFTSVTQEALAPLGLSLYDVRGNVEPPTNNANAMAILSVGFLCFVVLIVGIGMYRKRKWDYRDRNTHSAHVWYPAKDENPDHMGSNSSLQSAVQSTYMSGYSSAAYYNRNLTANNTLQVYETQKEDPKSVIRNSEKVSALHRAALGTVADVQNVIKSMTPTIQDANGGLRVNVDLVDEFENTPLMYAAQTLGNAQVVEFLVANGADPNHCNHDGLTALHLSLEIDDAYSANYLLSLPIIDATIAARGEDTPLKIAVINRFSMSLKILKRMVELDIDLDQTDDGIYAGSKRRTALHKAAELGHVDYITLLVDKGADINFKDIFGQTPLHLAVLGFRERAIQKLVELGADVEIADMEEKTPLMWAQKKCYHLGEEILQNHQQNNISPPNAKKARCTQRSRTNNSKKRAAATAAAKAKSASPNSASALLPVPTPLISPTSSDSYSPPSLLPPAAAIVPPRYPVSHFYDQLKVPQHLALFHGAQAADWYGNRPQPMIAGELSPNSDQTSHNSGSPDYSLPYHPYAPNSMFGGEIPEYLQRSQS